MIAKLFAVSTLLFGAPVLYAAAIVTGDLYVADLTGTIQAITPGGVVSTFATLTEPYGVVFDSFGDLYVADISTDDIYEFTPGGAESTYATGFSSPTSLAVDSLNDLYVVENGNGQIIEIKPGNVESTFATGIGGVMGAVDATNNVYVLNSAKTAVLKISPGGTQTTFISGLTSTDNISGFAFDASGNFYLSDAVMGSITEYTASGALVGVLTNNVPQVDRLLYYNNLFYATSLDTNSVDKITTGGTVTTFASVNVDTGDLRQMAIAPAIAPEPGSFVLLWLGAAGLGAYRWRLRHKSR